MFRSLLARDNEYKEIQLLARIKRLEDRLNEIEAYIEKRKKQKKGV